jgi:hypothetical protein
MTTAVGTRGEGGMEAELLVIKPKLALTPDKENTEWEVMGGEERSVSATGAG